MSTIVIKDLPESIALDRQAMLAITGGSRGPSRSRLAGRPPLQGTGLLARPVSLFSKSTSAFSSAVADKPRK